MKRFGLILLNFLYLASSVCLADEVVSKGGRVYTGKILYDDESSVYIETTGGGVINVQKADVASSTSSAVGEAVASQAPADAIGSPDGAKGLQAPLAARVGKGGVT